MLAARLMGAKCGSDRSPKSQAKTQLCPWEIPLSRDGEGEAGLLTEVPGLLHDTPQPLHPGRAQKALRWKVETA